MRASIWSNLVAVVVLPFGAIVVIPAAVLYLTHGAAGVWAFVTIGRGTPAP